ncbi:hypothetical protein GFO_0684 [Christiangramia forsetii KT0803]|uniref:Uncharacterized protein n=1 Tax=Christiangramia forsetii (strain DSM 17595 / CGMCC 1.15422 / KT0803) TaxID=411154 RepID=A0LZ66_CHRFK|nr:hypothetical protein GFO_0684 [Christiangramia forsetii KT0803]
MTCYCFLGKNCGNLLTSRSYETKEGEKRYVTEVVANKILLPGRTDGSTSKMLHQNLSI